MQLRFDALVFEGDNIFDIDPYDNLIRFDDMGVDDIEALLKICEHNEKLSVACYPYIENMDE